MFLDSRFIYYGLNFFLVLLPFVYLVIILFFLLFPFFPFSKNVSKIYVSNVNVLLPLAEALLFLLFLSVQIDHQHIFHLLCFSFFFHHYNWKLFSFNILFILPKAKFLLTSPFKGPGITVRMSGTEIILIVYTSLLF